METQWLSDQSEDVQTIIIMIGIIIISISVGFVFKRLILRRIAHIVKRTPANLDDVFSQITKKVGLSLYVAIGLLIGIHAREVGHSIYILVIVFSSIVIGSYFIVVADFVLRKGLWKAPNHDNVKEYDIKDDETVIRFVSTVAKALMWILLILIVLQNAGYNATTLLGGLGVIGLAVAFAVQNILEDIFSFLAIYFDKPFKVGDYIVIGDDSGFVEKIGIKTTRIRTLQGQELIVSNQELTSERIDNFKKMQKRRVEFRVGLTYGTPNEKLKMVHEILKEIIEKIEIAELDRVHFKTFGEFALIFEIVYFVNSPDYTTYMDVQQKINLELKKQFEKEDIEMAFPTQTIILQNNV